MLHINILWLKLRSHVRIDRNVCSILLYWNFYIPCIKSVDEVNHTYTVSIAVSKTFSCTISQLCIILKEWRPQRQNRAPQNKVSCLHMHCAVMNCVIAPLRYALCVTSTPVHLATVLTIIASPPPLPGL